MPDPDPRNTLIQLVYGHMAAQVVGAAAQLGLADLIGYGSRPAEDLATAAGAHPESMARLLRAMAALGLLTETHPGTFTLTPTGALLRTDRPDSMHALVQMFTHPAMVASWGRLPDSVRTGNPTFDKVFGTDFFSYLAAHPDLSTLFNSSMRQGTLSTAAAVPTAYDFSRFHTVVDVGGGDGTLLAAILANHPSVRGILFDSPAGLTEAPATLAGYTNRCTMVSGDFFTSVPAGGDLYVLKSVIHDWDDERATTILRLCRRVMPDEGRLLIVERVLPDVVEGDAGAAMYLSDLNMMVNVGGRERRRSDFENLLHRCGFTLGAVAPLPPPSIFSLIEGAPTRP